MVQARLPGSRFPIPLLSILIHAHYPPAFCSEKECIVEAIAYPGSDPVMWSGLYAASNGNVYSGLCSEGSSAHFYEYDPRTGVHICVSDLAEFLGERGKGIRTSGKIHNQPVEDNKGNIYFTTINNGSGPRTIDYTSWQGGHWLRYDPKEKRLTDLGIIDEGTGCYPLVIDKKRNLLFGIGFNGYLYRYDIEKGESKNLGRVDNWDICRDIAADDEGNVFGCFPVSRIWKYNAQTEKIFDLDIQIPFDPAIFPTQLNNPMIDRSTVWRAVEWDPVERVMYGVTCGSGSLLFRYDPYDGAEGSVTALGKLCDSRFLDSERKDIPYSTLAFALDSKNRRIYFAPSARGYEIGRYAETFGSEESHHLIMYDLKADKRIDLGALKTTDGRRVFGCEAASCGPDGTLYICGQVEVRNPAKGTWTINGLPVALHILRYTQR